MVDASNHPDAAARRAGRHDGDPGPRQSAGDRGVDTFDTDDAVFRALEAGATGFLLKEASARC
jgi:hypothetical protein